MAYALTVASEVEACDDLGSYKEAITSIDENKWLGGMKQDIKFLNRNHTWSTMKPPKNKRIVGCKWVFKLDHLVMLVPSKKLEFLQNVILKLKVLTSLRCSCQW